MSAVHPIDVRAAAPSPGPTGTNRLALLLELEAAARRCETPQALRFHAVNETRQLLEYRQAAWLATPRSNIVRTRSVSSLPTVDRNAPFIRWLERCARVAASSQPGSAVIALDANDFREHAPAGADEFAPVHAMVVRMAPPAGAQTGLLWFSRESPWSDADLVIAERLAEVYAHAQRALAAPHLRQPRAHVGKLLALLALLATLAAMFVPVRLSALAPAEVVPVDPWVISAPLNGVIKDVLIEPNTNVEASTVVLRYDDTTLRNELAVAERSVLVAAAEYRRATQGAFRDGKAKGQLTALKARVELATAERDYAAENLGRVDVRAGKGGFVLMPDKQMLIGRPVEIGQRIMEVADTARVELRVDLPVEDAIVSEGGAQVRVFLDIDPLRPLAATLERVSYHATVRADGLLAYQLRARFDEQAPVPRPGLRGTAKIYGEQVALGFYLLRRPFAHVRQLLGL